MTPRRMLLTTVGSLGGLAVALLVLLWPSDGAGGAAAQYRTPAPLPAPDFALTAHTGESVRMSELGRDHLLVLFFGYTHCPDICPLTLADLGRARGQLGKDAERVRILLVTVDPARDTPAQLADYVKRFPGDATGLTGSEEALRKTASDYLAFAERAQSMPGMGEDYLFDHTARSFVVKDRHVLMTFPPQTPIRDIAAGLRLLLQD